MRKSILLLAVLLLPSTVFAQQAYYIKITPKGPAGPSCYMGPWSYQAACRDVLGSLLYAHPEACHTQPNPANCAIIGNGLAYPHDFAPVANGKTGVRVEPERQIAPNDCVKLPTAQMPKQYGWVGLFYANDGTCEVWPVNPANRRKYRTMQAQGLGVIPLGSFNSACPGYPHSFVGSGVGQNDFACY